MPGEDDPTRTDPTAVPQPGQVVASRYEIEGILAHGGMGVVLRARDLRLGQPVALKILRWSEGRRDEQSRRFLREARIVAQLRSEHVVRVLDVDPAADPPYLAMELLEGHTLAEILGKRRQLDVTTAVRVVAQACHGVADAHAKGVIHRDLKPSNLMVTRGPDGAGRVKVIDFGISKPLLKEGEPGLTTSGQILGSPRYMAPEQVRGIAKVDERVDVWALGAILYELVTGEAPFDAPTVADTLARIVRDEPPPLRSLVPEVSESLSALVARCLCKEAERRPPTVRALVDALEAAVAPGPFTIDDPMPDVTLTSTQWPETPSAAQKGPTMLLRGATTHTTPGTSSERRAEAPRARGIAVGGAVLAVVLVAVTFASGVGRSRAPSVDASTATALPPVPSPPASPAPPLASVAPSAPAPLTDDARVASAAPDAALGASATRKSPASPRAVPSSTHATPSTTTSAPASSARPASSATGPYDGLDLDRRN